ncbi:MAG: hypothetical protein IPI68_08820 [Chitinophagaceae bacterium]|nr:hypothetical protein [Chitinophagaceae bacterium]
MQFKNSPDNVLFNSYQQYMSVKGKDVAALQQQLKTAPTKKDSTRLIVELTQKDKVVASYRKISSKKSG